LPVPPPCGTILRREKPPVSWSRRIPLEAPLAPLSDTTSGQGDLGRQIHRIRYVLEKRKWWTIGTLVLVMAVVVLVTQRQPRIYRATSSVIIEASPPRVLSGVKDVVELGSSNYWALRDYFQTQYKVITGMDVCGRVVEKLGLDQDPEYLGVPPGETITDEERRDRLVNMVPARALQARLTVEPVRESMMVLVHADDRDPKRAADLANEVVYAYRAQNIEYRRSVTQEANGDLREMVDKYRQRKEEADQEMLGFERKHGVGSFASRRQTLEDRVKMLNERQGQLLIRKADLGARVARIAKISTANDLFAVPLDAILSSGLVSGLKAKYVDLRDQRSKDAVQYGEKHPRIVALDAQLAEMKTTLKREVDTYLQSIRGDFEETVAGLREVDTLLTTANDDLGELAALQVEYNALAERKKDSDGVYDQVRTRFTEISLSAQVEMNNVRVNEMAMVPARPIRPDLRLNLAIGLMAGLLLGLGLAFLVEQLDTSVKDREEVEARTGVPCLGLVPSIPGPRKRRSRRKDQTLQERDFYVLQNPKSVISEALNTIRTNLMFVLPDRKIRTVLVTSGSPWEGKSTVVIAMGITQARYGARTLLIDADMRRPRLHRAFGVTADTGLSTLLLGGGNIDAAIQHTDIPNLDILPCGPVPPNPAELLRMERVHGLLDELKLRYDTIILDSPPIIPVSDPRILGGMVDGVLLVVKLGHTTVDALSQVRRELAAVGAPLLGTVLNDLDIRRPGYYGYRYGYGQGYYGRYTSYEGYPSVEDDDKTDKPSPGAGE
jgi:capsular exopolysaccharide synthesis family protein